MKTPERPNKEFAIASKRTHCACTRLEKMTSLLKSKEEAAASSSTLLLLSPSASSRYSSSSASAFPTASSNQSDLKFQTSAVAAAAGEEEFEYSYYCNDNNNYIYGDYNPNLSYNNMHSAAASQIFDTDAGPRRMDKEQDHHNHHHGHMQTQDRLHQTHPQHPLQQHQHQHHHHHQGYDSYAHHQLQGGSSASLGGGAGHYPTQMVSNSGEFLFFKIRKKSAYALENANILSK